MSRAAQAPVAGHRNRSSGGRVTGRRGRTTAHRRVGLGMRIANLVTVVVPFAGLVAAVLLLWPDGIEWVSLALLVGMYVLTGLGVTVGYHRLFTHRAFDAGPATAAVLGVLGSMAAQGPLLRWVATHRQHHQHSDHDGDPHSPHAHGHGLSHLARGLWHAHLGWIVSGPCPDVGRYAPDLAQDPVARWIDRSFPVWLVAGLLLPAVLGGVVTGSWHGALLGFLWGGLARVFLVHHVTWSVNSICHVWGSQPFDTHDHSRNNALCGVLAMGEGWHNNHHAFPRSARHGLAWWQVDASYLVIRALERLGLAWNVHVPTPERVRAKRRRRDSAPARVAA